MKVLVAGATGHIGANLVRTLLEQGRTVHALVRKDTRALEGLDIEHISGDVRDRDSLIQAFKGIDIVYNLAAEISIVGSKGGLVKATNVDGVRNIVETCKTAGIKRLVHFSSIHAFEQIPLNEILDENRPLVNSKAPSYDISKARGICVVLQAVSDGLDAVIVCPTGVIGPHDYKGSRMGIVIHKLATGKFPALVDGGFDWVDVRDIVAGAVAAEEKGQKGELYILGGGWKKIAEVAKIVEEISGIKAPEFLSPIWLASLAAPFSALMAKITQSEPLFTLESLKALKLGNRKISIAKASRKLGYTSRPLTETIEAAIEWQKGQLS